MTLLMYRFSNPNVRLFSPLCENRRPCRAAEGPQQDWHSGQPQEAVQRTHCSVKPHRDWPQKIPGVCIPQKLNKCQGHSKLFIGLVEVGGGIWSFNKSTQISGPLSNTANKLSCLRRASFSLRFYITGFISGTTKYSENLIS